VRLGPRPRRLEVPRDGPGPRTLAPVELRFVTLSLTRTANDSSQRSERNRLVRLPSG
jgi:hypothetical protein